MSILAISLFRLSYQFSISTIKTAILTGDVSQVFRMVDGAEMDAPQKTHWEEEELN